MEPVSPELALVDPELAARARRQLPEPPDALARRPPGPTMPVAPASADPDRSLTDVARAATSLRFVVVAVMLASAFLGPVAVDLLSRSGNAGASGSGGESTAVPRPVTSVPGPGGPGVELRWQSVSGAVSYDVIVWRGGARVLDLWPTGSRVRIPYAALDPGRYLWFVYPRAGSGRGFGPLAGHGSFAVPETTAP
jgi:hypothetical protein